MDPCLQGRYTSQDMINDVFERLGYSPAQCAELLQDVRESPETLVPIQRLKEQVHRAGHRLQNDSFERALLAYAAHETFLRIDNLPVYEPVKSLIREEIQFYTSLANDAKNPMKIGSYLFGLACKIVSLRRFPSGPMDWEVSGFPRSWLVRLRKRELPRVLRFLFLDMGGLAPMFFMHVARKPKNRSLIIEREVLRSYYRMARSLELQPTIKGILASAWFHDPAAVARYPHLSWLSRPYLESGGLIAVAGLAPADSGFAEHSLERQEQFARGEVQFRMGIAMWPRRNALEWARGHPELQS